MSVITVNKRWQVSKIPYTIEPYNVNVETWLQEINAAVGYDILTWKHPNDNDYVKATYGEGSGSSETIGKKGGVQTIGGDNVHTMIHEMLHALGFFHEQLHKKYPWDDNDPKFKKFSRFLDYNRKIKTRHNIALFKAIEDGSGIMHMGKTFYANNNLLSRLERVKDQNTEHRGKCDLDSVMMYEAFATAVDDLDPLDQMPGSQQFYHHSGIAARSNNLSNDDVATLRYMFPNVPRLFGTNMPQQHNLLANHAIPSNFLAVVNHAPATDPLGFGSARPLDGYMALVPAPVCGSGSSDNGKQRHISEWSTRSCSKRNVPITMDTPFR